MGPPFDSVGAFKLSRETRRASQVGVIAESSIKRALRSDRRLFPKERARRRRHTTGLGHFV